MARSRFPSTRILLCAIAAASLLAASPASAQRARGFDPGQFSVARLHYAGGGDWYANQSSLINLLSELRRRTGLATTEREAVVTLDDERLFNYPLLYVTGHGTIRPDDDDLARLRAWLDAGGFFWADDNYGLDDSFRQMIRRLYPDQELVPLGADHPIYSAYYDLPGLPKIHEHDGLPAQGYAIFDQGRMTVFYTYSSDIGDGLEDPEVHGDRPEAREAAMRMAINVCYFALTQS